MDDEVAPGGPRRRAIRAHEAPLAAVHDSFAPAARRLGVASGAAVALLCAAHAGVLGAGLLTLPSPAHPVQPPWFTLMELLILAISPAMVALAVALHAWVPPGRKPLALAGVPLGDMQVRNLGIVGYALVFPVAAALLARLFHAAGGVRCALAEASS